MALDTVLLRWLRVAPTLQRPAVRPTLTTKGEEGRQVAEDLVGSIARTSVLVIRHIHRPQS
jgi:hypothetical protein